MSIRGETLLGRLRTQGLSSEHREKLMEVNALAAQTPCNADHPEQADAAAGGPKKGKRFETGDLELKRCAEK